MRKPPALRQSSPAFLPRRAGIVPRAQHTAPNPYCLFPTDLLDISLVFLEEEALPPENKMLIIPRHVS